jgi:hypothetical protein
MTQFTDGSDLVVGALVINGIEAIQGLVGIPIELVRA